MLVEYNNDVFNAELHGNKVNIWKYVPVDGSKKAQTRKGIVYYENYVSTSETSKPFSVSFFAEKNEKKYIIHSIIDKKMTIVCDDHEFAIASGFKELEHGVWIKTVDIDSFESFWMVKYVQDNNDKIVQKLNSTELLVCWEKYIKDVSMQ